MAPPLALLLLLSTLASPAIAAGETTTHIKLYWHDVVGGSNATAVRVADAGAVTNTSRSFFGAVVVIDDALTDGPDLTASRTVGRAQGTYVSAGKDKVQLMMSMNFVFQDGRYNGSSVAVFGRNEVFSDVREMAVVGGTGVFRWARGYAQARTHTLDLKTGDATVEYNLYIKH